MKKIKKQSNVIKGLIIAGCVLMMWIGISHKDNKEKGFTLTPYLVYDARAFTTSFEMLNLSDENIQIYSLCAEDMNQLLIPIVHKKVVLHGLSVLSNTRIFIVMSDDEILSCLESDLHQSHGEAEMVDLEEHTARKFNDLLKPHIQASSKDRVLVINRNWHAYKKKNLDAATYNLWLERVIAHEIWHYFINRSVQYQQTDLFYRNILYSVDSQLKSIVAGHAEVLQRAITQFKFLMATDTLHQEQLNSLSIRLSQLNPLALRYREDLTCWLNDFAKYIKQNPRYNIFSYPIHQILFSMQSDGSITVIKQLCKKFEHFADLFLRRVQVRQGFSETAFQDIKMSYELLKEIIKAESPEDIQSRKNEIMAVFVDSLENSSILEWEEERSPRPSAELKTKFDMLTKDLFRFFLENDVLSLAEIENCFYWAQYSIDLLKKNDCMDAQDMANMLVYMANGASADVLTNISQEKIRLYQGILSQV